MSKLIAIEGLDGSGKATQAKKLKDALNGYLLSYPCYDSPSSSLIKMYLNGDFGTDPNSVNAYAASTFYAIDRYADFTQNWKQLYNNTDTIFISDRYSASNIIYQASKITDETERERFIEWLHDFERIKLGIPEPDINIYLDVNPIVSQKLMSKRYKNDESKKDIHEKDLSYLICNRNIALTMAKKYKWIVIECTNNEQILSIDEIHEKILKAIKNTPMLKA